MHPFQTTYVYDAPHRRRRQMPMPSTRNLSNPDPSIQSQLYEELNRLSSFEICFHSQELVQELVQKNAEFILAFRSSSSSLLIGDQHSFLTRKSKVEEILKSFENILTRLRVASTIVSERKQALEKQAEASTATKADDLKRLQIERDQLIEQVKLKNSYVKFAEEKIADIIWQINAIQTLKH